MMMVLVTEEKGGEFFLRPIGDNGSFLWVVVRWLGFSG